MQEIVGLFTAALSDDSVRQWLGEGRPPEDVAVLAAGATLSGAPSLVVQEQAHELANLLHTADGRDQPKPLLGGTPWSSGLLRTATEKVNTHFGVRELQTAVVAEPHRPARCPPGDVALPRVGLPELLLQLAFPTTCVATVAMARRLQRWCPLRYDPS